MNIVPKGRLLFKKIEDTASLKIIFFKWFAVCVPACWGWCFTNGKTDACWTFAFSHTLLMLVHNTWRRRVSLESRYGMCLDFPSTRAEITFPSAESERLIFVASFSRSPVAPTDRRFQTTDCYVLCLSIAIIPLITIWYKNNTNSINLPEGIWSKTGLSLLKMRIL